MLLILIAWNFPQTMNWRCFSLPNQTIDTIFCKNMMLQLSKNLDEKFMPGKKKDQTNTYLL